jgi:predicted dehydrogenase
MYLCRFIQMKKCVDKYVGQPKLCQCRIDMGSTLGSTFNFLCDDVMGGGNVNLFGSHLIDLITYLTGQRATRVHGVTKTLIPNTATINGTRRITSSDFSVVQLEMDAGTQAQMLYMKLQCSFHLINSCLYSQEFSFPSR